MAQTKPKGKTNVAKPTRSKTKPATAGRSKSNKPTVSKVPKGPKQTGNTRELPSKHSPSRLEESSGSPAETLRPTVITARATQEYAPDFSAIYPQKVDLFLYGVDIYPMGYTGSSLRTHILNAKGNKVLAEIKRAVSYSSTITVADIADYVDTIFYGLHLLYSVKNYYALCYTMNDRSSLSGLFGNIYDETVPPSFVRLAKALDGTYIPPKVHEMAKEFSKPYYVDETPRSSIFMMTPWVRDTELAADFVTIMDAAATSFVGLTNFVDLNTAFGSPRYQNPSLPVEILNLAEFFSPEKFLSNIEVTYDNDMLDIWSNLPLEAADNVGTVRRHTYADDQTTIYNSSFGSSFKRFTNGAIPYYNTSVGDYEPGFLLPLDVVSANDSNNFRYINGAFEDVSVFISTAPQAITYGSMARMTNNTWDPTNTLRIVSPGSANLSTMGIEKVSDITESADAYLS